MSDTESHEMAQQNLIKEIMEGYSKADSHKAYLNTMHMTASSLLFVLFITDSSSPYADDALAKIKAFTESEAEREFLIFRLLVKVIAAIGADITRKYVAELLVKPEKDNGTKDSKN